MPVESYALGLLQKAVPGFLTIIRGNFFKYCKSKASTALHIKSKNFRWSRVALAFLNCSILRLILKILLSKLLRHFETAPFLFFPLL